MMTRIKFIGAGAGSGKTTAVVQHIADAIANNQCAPAGLVATTYTVKAAEELRERIRRELLERGLGTAADQLDQALVGTVHSVCARLLRRFAFEAGLSPEVRVMAEEDGPILRAQAVDAACPLAEVQAMQAVAEQLGQVKDGGYRWSGQLDRLLDEVRANDFDPAALPAIGEQAAQEFLELLPRPATEDLDALLNAAIRRTLVALETCGDTKDKTLRYLDELKETLTLLAAKQFTWKQWLELQQSGPDGRKKAVAALADPVREVLDRMGEHPRLHRDIADYTRRLFRLAQAALEQYGAIKRRLGVVDFADLEHLTLKLLRNNPAVRAACQERWQLVVVDEFQDTSPLQLALFLAWAELAPHSLWVGDPKQAIYGFRNTDPQLTDAVVDALRQAGVAGETLGTSHRSVAELVTLVNGLFAEPFQRTLGLPAAAITLQAKRPNRVGSAPALEFFDLRTGETQKNGKERKPKVDEIADSVAAGIHSLLDAGSGIKVFDRDRNAERPIEPGDVAVLCRNNTHGDQIASALTAAGFTVSRGGTGLLATPEGRFGLACLRRLADAQDSLAAAEVVALGSSAAPEEWLADRLRHLAAQPKDGNCWRLDGPAPDLRLARLEAARARAATLTPTEALDLALEAGDAFSTVSAWGPSATRAAQRRANLEALRGMAKRYTDRCTSAGQPATVGGLLHWCAVASQEKSDAKAGDPSPGAIQVLTYHRAKGLEWPVVVATDLTEGERTDLFEVQSVAGSQPFDLGTPLAGRRLRFWASPFGEKEKGVPLLDQLQQSAPAHAQRERAQAEALRLLYVGFTRARDRLVLVRLPGHALEWLAVLGSNALEQADQSVKLPSGELLPCAQRTLLRPALPSPPAEKTVRWLASAPTRTTRLPAVISPSHAPQTGSFQMVASDSYGPRLVLRADVDESVLGDTLHALIAAELLNPGQPDRLVTVQAQLAAAGLAAALAAEEVAAALERFRIELNRRFAPRALRVEMPFAYRNAAGQRVSGIMDLLLETAEGWVLVDHKSFPGGASQWAAKAETFSGQLALYVEAMGQLGLPLAGVWVHFPVGGGWVQLSKQERQPAGPL